MGSIAIVGIGLRLPGEITTLEQLWDFLSAGQDAIRDLPEGRWDKNLYDPSGKRPGYTYVRRAGWVDGLDLLDAEFFGLSPKEASRMDPQQRMLLETSFESLENAGIPLEAIARRRIGVFVGLSSVDYSHIQFRNPRTLNAYTNTGSAGSIAANRVSYIYDLCGPSMTVDTACSSGLTALDQAIKSIESGDSEFAIVGAANALLVPEMFAGFSAATMLSPVGQCRAFDADGAGFVRAEGAVSIVIKPLDMALENKDPILGVIQASSCNNDGRTSGLSLPSADSQRALLEHIYGSEGFDTDRIVYVEAHGTGTAAGDPIEASAIGAAISLQRKGEDSLLIGSIKSNIGHLEPASGMAGLAKVLAIHRHKAVPPSLHFETPNPNIPFDEWRLRVPTAVEPLPEAKGPAAIGINSFGFGGANAHAVIEEPPSRDPVETVDVKSPWYLISARSEPALQQVARDLGAWLDAHPDTDLGHLSAALLTRRTWHKHRAAFFADSLPQIQDSLHKIAVDEPDQHIASGSALATSSPVFVFTGNGVQWWAMGRQLLEQNALFRETVEEIDAIFQRIGGFSLLE